MKRTGNLYGTMISDENIIKAIKEVNKTHRWKKHHKPNKVVAWVESDIPARVIELREIIENGFEPSECHQFTIYDKTSEKYRDIFMPKLWPDQYIHHILVQVLQKSIMRKMDNWVCGSIPGRGIHYGVKGIKKWMRNGKKTKYCAELDIRHFYQNIQTEIVIESLLKIIKDRRVIDLCERILRNGVSIGLYTSQWFANLILQELDEIIRKNSSRYIRYMDNLTIFSANKRKLIYEVSEWLHSHKLKLKSNWQLFRTKNRMPQALGYRYGNGYLIPRKRNLFRLKRQLARVYKRIDKYGKPSVDQACGLMSRIGQLKWCNSTSIRMKYIKPGLLAKLKSVIRNRQRKDLVCYG